MARMEDRLKLLENRKRLYKEEQFATPTKPPRPTSRVPSNSQRRHSSIWQSIESDNSDSSSNIDYHWHKRQRYTKGIKVIPSYTLKVSSSLREWGDWKRDIKRVFEGDPYIYKKGGQKILKALDYLDPNLKSLWYTYSKQKEGIRTWILFLN